MYKEKVGFLLKRSYFAKKSGKIIIEKLILLIL